MEIKNLAQTDLESIVECFLNAFSEYFIQLPAETSYWAGRFHLARVDYSLSFGVFDDEKLVAFIMNGIDLHEGKLTAFNTGTGVISEYRNQQLVDKMYDFGLPFFKERGIEKCVLEVVQKNDRAIRVYERIGFEKTRDYWCFRGEIKSENPGVEAREISFEAMRKFSNPNSHFYSWDNQDHAIELSREDCRFYEVFDEKAEKIGFFIFNPRLSFLAQIEIFDTNKPENWQKLFAGARQVGGTVKINNVDARRRDLISAIIAAGLDNHINQYEMEMNI